MNVLVMLRENVLRTTNILGASFTHYNDDKITKVLCAILKEHPFCSNAPIITHIHNVICVLNHPQNTLER